MYMAIRSLTLVAVCLMATETTALAGDWPGFLGPRRDGQAVGETLDASFPPGGPRLVWRRAAGPGYAGPAVVGERLILFHQVGGEEVVEALDIATGAVKWKTGYPCDYQGGYGTGPGPRATPVVVDGVVHTFGAAGVLQALSLVTGEVRWRRDLHKDYRVPDSYFGVGSTPLVEGKLVLVNLGCPQGAGLVAFDAATGKTIWEKTNDTASYSSPVAATIKGTRWAFFFSRSGLYGVDPATGAQRFFHRWRARINASVNAATPLVVDDVVFVSACYNTGALAMKVSDAGAKVVWSGDEVLSNHYDTSVYHDGFLYGVDGRQDFAEGRLACVELATGARRWAKEGFGCGSIIKVGARLLILTEAGELVWVACDPEAYKEFARVRVIKPLARPAPALSNGQFFCRNEDELIRVDLRPATSE